MKKGLIPEIIKGGRAELEEANYGTIAYVIVINQTS
jgi:hypothetical protein